MSDALKIIKDELERINEHADSISDLKKIAKLTQALFVAIDTMNDIKDWIPFKFSGKIPAAHKSIANILAGKDGK